MEASTLYSAGADGHGVTVGIIDTGILASSPEFAGRISSKSVDATGAGRGISDPFGHGTGVASIIGAARNGLGTMGVAYQSTLLVLRAEDPGSCATTCSFSFSNVANAVNLATSGGARVINMSMGADSISADVVAAIRSAAQKGVVVVIAAGNEYGMTPSVFAQIATDPTMKGMVMIVGALNADNTTMASFSNRAGAWGAYYIAAPGRAVTVLGIDGGLDKASGTSFAAPQVSGAVALLAQQFPNLTGKQIIDILYRSATSLGDSTVAGHGRLSLAKALAPLGTLSLAGLGTAAEGVPAPSSAGTRLSAPLGDAVLASKSLSGVVGLDDYRRAYRFDLTYPLHPGLAAPVLASAFAARETTQRIPLGQASAMLRLTTPDRFAWTGVDPFAPLARLRAGRAQLAGTTLTVRARGALAIDAGLGGASRIGLGTAPATTATAPRLVAAHDPLDGMGLAARAERAVGARLDQANRRVGIFAEQGALDPPGPWRAPVPLAYAAWGVMADQAIGPWQVSGGASFVTEAASLLGSRWDPAFGLHGARTMLFDGRVAWHFASRWQIAAGLRQGWTVARTGGGMVTGARLRSDASTIGLEGGSVLRPGDGFALRWARPLRVHAGQIAFNLPVGYSYDTGKATFARRVSALVPRGREQDLEAAYRLVMGPAELGANVAWRHQPDNLAAAPDQLIAAATARFAW